MTCWLKSVVLGLLVIFSASSLWAGGPVTPPFTQCPPVGADASCAILIVIDATGKATVLADPSQGPLDFIEDTLIGVQNNSGQTILSLSLSSTAAIFALDGDGLCNASPSPAGCPFGPTGYEGPKTMFSNVSFDGTSGVVNFLGGIPPGGSAYFSLEEALAPTQINPGGSQVTATFLGPSGTSINPTGSFAEPINTATGNYYTAHADLVVPGKGGPLAFVRYYNSLDTYNGPLGFGWTHSYNIFLRQVANTVIVKEPDGHEDVFTATGGGSYAPLTAGLFDTVRMNADGSFTLTRKYQTQFTFSPAGVLLSVADRNNNSQVLNYVGGNLATITDSSGRALVLGYDGSNRLVTLTDPMGRIFRYAYDDSGTLKSAQDASGRTTQYGYDSNHRMLSVIDPRGNTFLQNTFDAQGRVIQQLNADGYSTAFAYDTPSVGTTTITDALGNVTKHVHDTNLRLIAIVDALGGSISFTYSASNLRTGQVDQLGRTTSFSYDVNGNLTSATDANGKVTQFTYDSRNNVLQITDRLGRLTRFAYDSKGNLLTATDPTGGITSFTYDLVGEIVTVKNARNALTTFGYDTAGNRTQIVDAAGSSVRISYDVVGRPLSMRNQLGNSSIRTYDANNRLLSITDPLSNTTQFAYDANGNMTKLTDANGKTTIYAYSPTNKLVQVTDANGGVTTYSYNGNLDLSSATDAKGHAKSYSYDSLRRLKTVTDPLGRQESYGYDAVGNATSTTDGNGKTNSLVYDSLNRLVSMSLSDGKHIAFSYDAVGNRLSMNDSLGLSTYAYDPLNRVLSVTTPGGKVIGYAYDGVGNRTKLTNATGKAIEYHYDALNRLIGVADWNGNVTTYSYDAAGNLVSAVLPNRTSSAYTFDADNRLLSVTNTSKNSTLSGVSYLLDKVGNRLQVTSARGNVTKYAYDSLNRLISWTTPDGDVTQYGYDAVGNRLSMAGPNGKTTYTYDAADQLLSAGPMTFAYDGNGNRVKKTVQSGAIDYSWDALNHLLSISGGGVNSRFVYDGDGNRISQQRSVGTYQYVNDIVIALPGVVSESGPDGAIDYVHGLFLVSESIGFQQDFYQFDGLGSVTTVTNAAGAHQANYGYDPWGQAINPTDPPIGLDALTTTNKYRFAGEALDPDTGLYYLRARYYDPTTGRFLSRDSSPGLRLWPSTRHPYVYSLNDPTQLSDPSGKFVWFIPGLAGAAVNDLFYAGQVIFGHEQFSWSTLAGRTAGGFVAPYAFLACEAGTAILGGACAGAAEYATDRLVQNGITTLANEVTGSNSAQFAAEPFSWSGLAAQTVLGGFLGPVSEFLQDSLIGPIVGRNPTSLITLLTGREAQTAFNRELIDQIINFLGEFLIGK